MNVLFLLEQVEVLDLLGDPDDVNPGVGGTSYLILQLANRINQEWQHANRNEHEVILGCWVATSQHRHYRGMKVIHIAKDCDGCPDFDIAIATGGALEAIGAGEIAVKSTRLIAWIHHPFDWDKIGLAKKLGAEIVSIGLMQYMSNALIGGRHHHIENIFNATCIRNHAHSTATSTAQEPHDGHIVEMGYMGALIPSKGFHTILEQWDGIRSCLASLNKQPKLHVIGGSTLYSYNQSHPDLPCEREYGTYLKKLMADKAIDDEAITFYGVLGSDRYPIMAKCDLAIVNPEGYGEAFPATILEWLSLGIPTVTSKRFGLSDVASKIPELCLEQPKELGKTIAGLLNLDVHEREELQSRCMAIADLYSSKQAYIVQQWSYLLNGIHGEILRRGDARCANGRPFNPRITINDGINAKQLRQLAEDYLDMLVIRLKRKAKLLAHRLINP